MCKIVQKNTQTWFFTWLKLISFSGIYRHLVETDAQCSVTMRLGSERATFIRLSRRQLNLPLVVAHLIVLYVLQVDEDLPQMPHVAWACVCMWDILSYLCSRVVGRMVRRCGGAMRDLGPSWTTESWCASSLDHSLTVANWTELVWVWGMEGGLLLFVSDSFTLLLYARWASNLSPLVGMFLDKSQPIAEICCNLLPLHSAAPLRCRQQWINVSLTFPSSRCLLRSLGILLRVE